jgi:HTH-type transcriptional regulator, cell division transcriptional repressor
MRMAEPTANCAPVHPTFGARLKAARLHAKLSQRELAQRLGCVEFSVSRWEHDRSSPTLENVHRMADLCGVARAWLSSGTGGMVGPEGVDAAE